LAAGSDAEKYILALYFKFTLLFIEKERKELSLILLKCQLGYLNKRKMKIK